MYRGLPDKSIAQVSECGNCGEHGQQRFYKRTAPRSRIVQAPSSWELARIHRASKAQRADTVVHRTTLFALTPTALVFDAAALEVVFHGSDKTGAYARIRDALTSGPAALLLFGGQLYLVQVGIRDGGPRSALELGSGT